jgi:hypothetical protein
MLAHAFTYAEAVISYWFTGFWFLTAVPVALSYVLPDTTFEMAGKRLDSWVRLWVRLRLPALSGAGVGGAVGPEEPPHPASSVRARTKNSGRTTGILYNCTNSFVVGSASPIATLCA